MRKKMPSVLVNDTISVGTGAWIHETHLKMPFDRFKSYLYVYRMGHFYFGKNWTFLFRLDRSTFLY